MLARKGARSGQGLTHCLQYREHVAQVARWQSLSRQISVLPGLSEPWAAMLSRGKRHCAGAWRLCDDGPGRAHRQSFPCWGGSVWFW